MTAPGEEVEKPKTTRKVGDILIGKETGESVSA